MNYDVQPDFIVGPNSELSKKKNDVWVAQCLRVDVPNSNKRVYPRHVIEAAINKLTDSINQRGLMGELDQPLDSIIHHANTSHLITALKLNGEYLEAEIEILYTPRGLILKEMLDKYSSKIAFRPRGIGNGKVDEHGMFIVGDSYKLVTIDAVESQEASTL